MAEKNGNGWKTWIIRILITTLLTGMIAVLTTLDKKVTASGSECRKAMSKTNDKIETVEHDVYTELKGMRKEQRDRYDEQMKQMSDISIAIAVLTASGEAR